VKLIAIIARFDNMAMTHYLFNRSHRCIWNTLYFWLFKEAQVRNDVRSS